MNIWVFLPLLLVGLGTLVAGAVSMVMGRRRRPIMLPIGGVIIAGAVAAGALIPDGSSAEASATQPAQFAFLYPAESETLDAQDFILEGTGIAGESLEILANGTPLSTVNVGDDNKWSYYIAKPNVGDYEFEVKSPSQPTNLKRKVIVQQGVATASNAQCPCRLRFVVDDRQDVIGAVVTLFKDGTEIKKGNLPLVFDNLEAATYTYTVEAPGKLKVDSAAKNKNPVTPKNKNISVYLDNDK
jgi:hypothetical protein